MILEAFTFVHVALSLVGILAGFVVLYGLLRSSLPDRWTSIFLWTTLATSVTGFFFPVHHFLPSHGVGIVSILVLALAIPARNVYHLAGGWRRTFVISSVFALYLNVFVLIVQLFLKVPTLKALAPTQSDPPFKLTQLTALVIFLALGIMATSRFGKRSLQTTWSSR